MSLLDDRAPDSANTASPTSPARLALPDARKEAAWRAFRKANECECACGCPLVVYDPDSRVCYGCARDEHRPLAIQARTGWLPAAEAGAITGDPNPMITSGDVRGACRNVSRFVIINNVSNSVFSYREESGVEREGSGPLFDSERAQAIVAGGA